LQGLVVAQRGLTRRLKRLQLMLLDLRKACDGLVAARSSERWACEHMRKKAVVAAATVSQPQLGVHTSSAASRRALGITGTRLPCQDEHSMAGIHRSKEQIRMEDAAKLDEDEDEGGNAVVDRFTTGPVAPGAKRTRENKPRPSYRAQSATGSGGEGASSDTPSMLKGRFSYARGEIDGASLEERTSRLAAASSPDFEVAQAVLLAEQDWSNVAAHLEVCLCSATATMSWLSAAAGSVAQILQVAACSPEGMEAARTQPGYRL